MFLSLEPVTLIWI